MIYRFDITHHGTGTMTVECQGHTAGSERVLARVLVESGAPDGAVEAGRVGKLDWTAPSLHVVAAGTLSEGDKGFTSGVYAPYPPRVLHPALGQAVFALSAKRRAAFEDRVARGIAAKTQKALTATPRGL
jgi:hypothetical protein